MSPAVTNRVDIIHRLEGTLNAHNGHEAGEKQQWPTITYFHYKGYKLPETCSLWNHSSKLNMRVSLSTLRWLKNYITALKLHAIMARQLFQLHFEYDILILLPNVRTFESLGFPLCEST